MHARLCDTIPSRWPKRGVSLAMASVAHRARLGPLQPLLAAEVAQANVQQKVEVVNVADVAREVDRGLGKKRLDIR